MRLGQLTRQLIAVIIIPLFAVPLWGSSPNSGFVGTVTDAAAATVAGAVLASGTNVYNGDIISTANKGDAWISLPGDAGILLGANSDAQIRKESPSGPIIFDIAQGVVKFRSTDKTTVDGYLFDATIAPANSLTASGFVEFTGPDSAIIAAETGDLLVTASHDGSSRLIPAGSMMAVRLVPSSAQAEDQNQTRTAKHRRGFIVLLGIVMIGTITAIAIILNHHEKKKVSPSSFPS